MLDRVDAGFDAGANAAIVLGMRGDALAQGVRDFGRAPYFGGTHAFLSRSVERRASPAAGQDLDEVRAVLHLPVNGLLHLVRRVDKTAPRRVVVVEPQHFG